MSSSENKSMVVHRRAFGAAFILFAAAAMAPPSQVHAQLPPDPNFQRQQVFESYQAFRDRLAAIAAITDASQRTSELNALWGQLRTANQVPYVQDAKVAFLYRGAASSVAWPGDFNGWNPGSASWRGAQLAGTDLWILEKTFAPDARLDYKIVTGGSNWILDPANPLQMWSGFGPNSELRMPQYEYPLETVRQAGVPRGMLSGNIKVASNELGYDVNYRVYTPAGYSQQSRQLPVVYVTDGHEYAADHMGSMVVVLDNLIAAGSLQPTIAVFIDPRAPNNPGNNRRASEYVHNPNFAGFVADELVPAVDAAYGTLASPGGRTILGTSLGGLNSAYFGATRHDIFGNIAVQSPASFSFTPEVLNIYATQPLQDELDLFVTAGTVNDGNGGTNFAAVLQQHGYDYTFLERNEGHSWGQWRGLLDSMLIELIGPTPALDADFNEDGIVDARDLTLWRAGANKTDNATHQDGDADGDRDVDGADMLLWQRQLGSTTLPAATPVPEPSVTSAIGCSLLAGVRRLKHRGILSKHTCAGCRTAARR